MILLIHLLFGAAIGSVVKNITLGLFLAFSSHYLLDALPHVDYPIKNIKEKQWRRALPDALKVILDISLALLLLLIFSTNKPIVYVYGLIAVVPDGLTLLGYLFSNKFLEKHYNLHQKIHFLKNAKISIFWRFASQIIILFVSIALLSL